MTVSKIDEGSFVTAVRLELERRAAEMIEEEADKAAEEVRRRLRQTVANVAMSVLSHYEFESDRSVLTIRVKQDHA
ncbi:hypothetical protein [Enterovirga sp. CN4-39]|uniref:hypothetical protein n=1 Tax=Enterovirga sp. CN4-39 TaxID=3400910 RepID=UPI003BFADA0A